MLTVDNRYTGNLSFLQTTSLQVLAIADDRSSQATVIVNIEDMNDNSPIFTENVRIFSTVLCYGDRYCMPSFIISPIHPL